MLKFLESLLILSLAAFFAGCSDGTDGSGSIGTQFSYSVLTSDSGQGVDLLEQVNDSLLPELEREGAEEYAIWIRSSDSGNDSEEIAEDKLVVMLRWKEVEATRLAEELESMAGVSSVTTTLWKASLRAAGPLETSAGFYIHRFNRVLSGDADRVLELSEQAWESWEPFWGGKVVGVWTELNDVDESNGITRHMRIAWYRDQAHWQETREFWRDPDSVELFIERIALQLDNEGWSAELATN